MIDNDFSLFLISCIQEKKSKIQECSVIPIDLVEEVAYSSTPVSEVLSCMRPFCDACDDILKECQSSHPPRFQLCGFLSEAHITRVCHLLSRLWSVRVEFNRISQIDILSILNFLNTFKNQLHNHSVRDPTLLAGESAMTKAYAKRVSHCWFNVHLKRLKNMKWDDMEIASDSSESWVYLTAVLDSLSVLTDDVQLASSMNIPLLDSVILSLVKEWFEKMEEIMISLDDKASFRQLAAWFNSIGLVMNTINSLDIGEYDNVIYLSKFVKIANNIRRKIVNKAIKSWSIAERSITDFCITIFLEDNVRQFLKFLNTHLLVKSQPGFMCLVLDGILSSYIKLLFKTRKTHREAICAAIMHHYGELYAFFDDHHLPKEALDHQLQMLKDINFCLQSCPFVIAFRVSELKRKYAGIDEEVLRELFYLRGDLTTDNTQELLKAFADAPPHRKLFSFSPSSTSDEDTPLTCTSEASMTKELTRENLLKFMESNDAE
eukprot:GHVL01038921.1.p1 GENE.GHVL01038921.1~~GHVL01038921.1.p1  ORF type:complete len:490 (+),score=56.64 GHVL01038921.1:237-1706(+)